MKLKHVSVDFGPEGSFDFRLPAETVDALSRGDALAWFDAEFAALECDVASPVGKVLSVDRVLSVARYSGARRFAADPAWGERYALNALSLLGRELVRVDVPAATVGF